MLANLTEDLATEEGQAARTAAVLDAIDEIAGRTSSSGDAMLVSGSRRKYRHEMTAEAGLDVVVGSGMARTFDAAAGTMTLTTGTTANAETTFTTQESFTVPFKTQVGFRLSQKIINQEFYVEVVAQTTDGLGVDEGVVASWRIAGSDATNSGTARAEVRNGESQRSQSANLTVQNHVGADAIFEVTLESDEVWFSTKAMDNIGSRLTPYVRNSISPDPNRRYRVRIRAKNGGTAPASTTTMVVYYVTAVDYTEQQVEVTGGNGSVGAGQSIPVVITGGATTGTPSLAATAAVVGASIAKILSAASTNATLVKSSGGRLYGYDLANTSTSWRFVRLFNKTTAPSPGTDSPALVIALPPTSSKVVHLAVPTTLGTGIGYTITGASGDLDATVVAAGDVVGSLLYA